MIPMEPDGSQERSLTKKCTPFITGFTLVAGLAMFVTGVVVMIAQIAHEAISSVPIQTGPIVLLVAGLLSLLVAFFGCYFIKQNLTLNDMGKKIIVFMVLLLLAAVLAIVAGCLGINHRGKMENKFEADLKTKIEMYGRTGYETEAQIDRLQKEDKCCGVFTYADWRATVYGGHRYDRVPDSCCKEQKYGCGFKFIDEATLNKRGCASIAMDKMYTGLTSVGAVGLLFAISELILFVGFLICYLKHCCQISNPHEIGTVMIEYHKTDTPSRQEGVEPSSRGGDVTGEHGDGASSTEGHDAPTAKR